MSVLTQNTNVTYISSGSVGPYAFNFPISSPDSLTVTVNGSVQAQTAYTITPVNNDLDNGGSVTFVTAPTAGQIVILQRSTPITQARDFTDNMPQPMKQFEDALDKLTEIDQELAASIASGGGGGTATYVVAGTGIIVTGAGTLTNPYVISTASGFTITSFTGAQAGELGQTFTNPTLAATYAGTPTSAYIANTDGINTPFNLSSPFTSATIAGSFSHSTNTFTTFSLHATNGSTSQIALLTFTWNERIFAGLGATGATSSVTASGNNAVLSTSDVIGTAGLQAEVVGQTFGPFNPSGQAIYLLLTGGAHTFIDAVTGFPFAFQAPVTVSFVNQFGVSLTMYLYQSTNPLTGTFQPKITS